MAEYSWTIQIGAIRLGWIRHKYWNSLYEHHYRGYVRIGHLDFYNEKKFDGRPIAKSTE